MAEVLSQQRAAHALRHFIISGSLWSVYGPNAVVTGSVFTGFALSVGVRESQIAFLAALTGFVGVSQALTFYWTRRVANKRRFCVALGFGEITAASLPAVVCLLLPTHLRFGAVAGLLLLAYGLGHTVSPVFANWMANVVPDDARATYTARRMFTITFVSAAYLLLASRWLDLTSGNVRFLVVYGVGWLAGVLGYVMVGLTPFPPMVVEPTAGYGRTLLVPLRERSFALLVAFMATWTLAMSVAGPFYSVYMLDYLKLTYTRIAVYTNVTLVSMLAGYQVVGPLAERFGCKPIAKILIIPAMSVPVLWMLSGRATYPLLVPLACLLSGFSVAGLQVAGSALLYQMVPPSRENSAFFAVLTGFTAFGASVGAASAGALRGWLGKSIVSLGPLELTPPQYVFLISGCVYLVPVLASHFLVEPEAETAVGMLGKLRGNLLGLAYNYVLFSLARESRTRAHALRGMARSRVPLVVPKLSASLTDESPEVRQEAALGLGEAKAVDAVPQLVRHLADEGSDVRAEAAQALGQIGDPSTIEPLRQALHDPDARLRCSAALALGEIGGADAQDLLMETLRGPLDRALFPALVDAAGRAGDLRTVSPGLACLPHFDSPVIRMQIINGVCRALGEKNHFYRLVHRHGVGRSSMTEQMMRRIVRLLHRAPGLSPAEQTELAGEARQAAGAIERDDFGAMAEHARTLAGRVKQLPHAGEVAQAAASAVRAYVDQVSLDRLRDEGAVFVVIALTSLARHIARRPSMGDTP